jgi:hypothetical protein
VWLVAVLAVAAGSCKREIIYKDHEVVFDHVEETSWQDETPRIVPGTFEEQLFAPLKDGDPVQIVNGFQGGVWLHVSVRCFGMPPEGELTASLDLLDGSALGETTVHLLLARSAEGFREAYDIPIPIERRGADLQALEGARATLAVSYVAGDREVHDSVEVTLKAP